MTAEELPKQVTLSRGDVIGIEHRNGSYRLQRTHTIHPRGEPRQLATDIAVGAALDSTVLQLFNIDAPNKLTRELLNYVRSTEWGAELP
jgi:hypothetical protein